MAARFRFGKMRRHADRIVCMSGRSLGIGDSRYEQCESRKDEGYVHDGFDWHDGLPISFTIMNRIAKGRVDLNQAQDQAS
jgi:hypothetical protein